MPSKSRRAASRQAQLSGKRRRRDGRSRGATTSSTTEQERTHEVRRQTRPSVAAASPSTTEATGTVQAAQTAAPAVAATRRRSSRLRTPVEPLPMYQYLGSELRRIGALTGLVAITLAVLTVVLR